jgi:hypothetical protein
MGIPVLGAIPRFEGFRVGFDDYPLGERFYCQAFHVRPGLTFYFEHVKKGE